MRGSPAGPSPEPTRRWLRRASVVLVTVVLLAVLAIAAGLFDPRPNGSLLSTENPGRRDIGANDESYYDLSPPWPSVNPPARYSLRLVAAHDGGETDSAYGLALGGDDAPLVIGVSPLGYAAVRAGSIDAPDYLIPWQVWPHVRPGAAENEIWVDVASDGGETRATVRVNRELLWEGKVDDMPADFALWGASFGAPATVDFRSVEWFADLQ